MDKSLPTDSTTDSPAVKFASELFGDFTRSALHTSIQEPINSFTQMFNSKHLPDVQGLAPAKSAQTFSPKWHAQLAGSSIGSLADMIVIDKALAWTLSKASAKFKIAALGTAIVSQSAPLRNFAKVKVLRREDGKVLERIIRFSSEKTNSKAFLNGLRLTGTGAIYDGLFRPVDQKYDKEQLRERLLNARNGAVAMFAFGSSKTLLKAGGAGLEKAFATKTSEAFLKTNVGSKLLAASTNNILKNNIAQNSLAGSVAGLTHTELSERFKASQEQRLIGAYSGALMGGTFGLVESAYTRSRNILRKGEILELEGRTDYLSQLLNKKGLDDAMVRTLSRAMREGKEVTIIGGDLKGFKPINDNIGHKAGDEILAQVGKAIKDSLRTGDEASRPGGDEFTVVLYDCPEASAKIVLDRIKSEIGKIVAKKNGKSYPVGINLGTRTVSPHEIKQAMSEVPTEDVQAAWRKERGRRQLISKDVEQPKEPSREDLTSIMLKFVSDKFMHEADVNMYANKQAAKQAESIMVPEARTSAKKPADKSTSSELKLKPATALPYDGDLHR